MKFVRAAANTDSLEGYCLIKTMDKKTTAKGLSYLDMILTDSSGEIVAKFWDYKEELHSMYEANMLVKVRGKLLEYNGEPQFRVERIRPVRDDDGVRIEDFVPSADYSGEEMIKRIYSTIESIQDSDIHNIVHLLVSENEEKILFWPAAFKLHHAIRAGLLYHTLSIVKLCESVCNTYPFLDRDLLIGGAILHDIAKVSEYNVASTGLASGYTAKGELIGHLVGGAMMIEKAAEKLCIKSDVPMLLEHMVLSHHGEPEFGAAVRPMFIEAELLSELDLMDSRIYEMREAVSAAPAEDFSARVWAMDNRKLYNHTRTDLNKKTQLF